MANDTELILKLLWNGKSTQKHYIFLLASVTNLDNNLINLINQSIDFYESFVVVIIYTGSGGGAADKIFVQITINIKLLIGMEFIGIVLKNSIAEFT